MHIGLVVRVFQPTAICTVVAVLTVSAASVVVPAAAPSAISAVLLLRTVAARRKVTAVCAIYVK